MGLFGKRNKESQQSDEEKEATAATVRAALDSGNFKKASLGIFKKKGGLNDRITEYLPQANVIKVGLDDLSDDPQKLPPLSEEDKDRLRKGLDDISLKISDRSQGEKEI